jgi:hypothetical protein
MARSFWNVFAPLVGCAPRVRHRPTPSFRPSLLALEDRAMPSVVLNTLDGGPGSLRDAVAFAVPGETITFAGDLVGDTITLSSVIGSAIPLRIIGPGPTISGGDTSRIFIFSPSASTTIAGLTLTHGKAGPLPEITDEVVGGAILSEAPLTVNDCVFSNNIATDPDVASRGGAIWSDSQLTLNNDTFMNNSADDFGGAVAGLTDRAGGTTASVTANNCYFFNNGAKTGGALAAFDNLMLSGDFFNSNGGPLDPMTHLITRADNGGNVSAWNGGFGTPPITQIIDKTTLAGGKATNGGGLYYFDGLDLLLNNSTVYGNDAFFGGGIFKALQSSGLTIKSSTITANNAAFSGGGISNFDGSFLMKDSIVAGNTEGTPIYGQGRSDIMGAVLATLTVDGVVTATSDHNLIGDGRGMFAFDDTRVGTSTTSVVVDLGRLHSNQVGTETSPIDARLSDLRSNGGPLVGGGGTTTTTKLPTVALLANSPAIGAADPALAGTTDQNGTVRSATPNVGAIEYVASTADHVIFKTQPTDTPAGQTISSFMMEVVDQYGNFVNNDNTDTVTLRIGNDPSGGTATLTGTLTLTFTNGIATFNDLSIDTTGTGYTLHATASVGPDTESDRFNIT